MYFSLALTSPDMTQPADNINANTTRHLCITVIHYHDVVYHAADMQTQDTGRNDKYMCLPVSKMYSQSKINDDTKLEHLMYQIYATECHQDHVTLHGTKRQMENQ